MDTKHSRISFFGNPFGSQSSEQLLLDHLKDIKSGKYQTQVERCRDFYTEDKIKYKNEKSKLPAVTFSATFGERRRMDYFLSYSGHIVIDLDGLSESEVIPTKERLFADSYCVAIWISPSGLGLKMLVRVAGNAEEHRHSFDALLNYLHTTHNVLVDKSGSDVCRLCFASYDSKLLQREEPKIFKYEDHPVPIKQVSERKQKTSAGQISSKRSSAVLYETYGKNKTGDRITFSKIHRFLSKKGLSITSNYDDWFRVACAIANSFTFDVGEKYFLQLCRLDEPLHDEYKSQQLLEYCYRHRRAGEVEFSTIVYLAQQKGFVVNGATTKA